MSLAWPVLEAGGFFVFQLLLAIAGYPNATNINLG